METGLDGLEAEPPLQPLKPSLVEWKLFYILYLNYKVNTLETFLSGMETSNAAPSPLQCYRP